MTGTKRCDRCWELEHRVLAEPGLTWRILAGGGGRAGRIAGLLEEMELWLSGKKSWTNTVRDPGDCAIADAQEVVKLASAIQAYAALQGREPGDYA